MSKTKQSQAPEPDENTQSVSGQNGAGVGFTEQERKEIVVRTLKDLTALCKHLPPNGMSEKQSSNFRKIVNNRVSSSSEIIKHCQET